MFLWDNSASRFRAPKFAGNFILRPQEEEEEEEAEVEQEPPPRPTRELYEEALAALTPELHAM